MKCRTLTLFGAVSLSFAGEPEPQVPVVTYTDYSDIDASFRIEGFALQVYVGYTNSTLGLSQNAFLGLGDILSNVDWMIPIGADFRKGKLGFLPTIVAMKLSGATTTPFNGFDRADVGMTMAMFNLPVYYRVVDRDDLSVDVLAGVRYLTVDLDVGLSGGVLGSALGPVSGGTNARVLNGIVGLRVQQDLTDSFFYSVYGDIGTGDSDLTWEVIADLGYRVSETFSASLGYRYLTFSQSSGANAVDLTASGPQLTLTWGF